MPNVLPYFRYNVMAVLLKDPLFFKYYKKVKRKKERKEGRNYLNRAIFNFLKEWCQCRVGFHTIIAGIAERGRLS